MRIQDLLYEADVAPTNTPQGAQPQGQQNPNDQTANQNAITPAMMKAYSDRLTAVEKALLQTASAAGVGQNQTPAGDGQNTQQTQAVGTTPSGQGQPLQQQGQQVAPTLPGQKPQLGQPQGQPMGQGPAPAPSVAAAVKPPPAIPVPGGGNPKQAITKIQQSLAKGIAGTGAPK